VDKSGAAAAAVKSIMQNAKETVRFSAVNRMIPDDVEPFLLKKDLTPRGTGPKVSEHVDQEKIQSKSPNNIKMYMDSSKNAADMWSIPRSEAQIGSVCGSYSGDFWKSVSSGRVFEDSTHFSTPKDPIAEAPKAKVNEDRCVVKVCYICGEIAKLSSANMCTVCTDGFVAADDLDSSVSNNNFNLIACSSSKALISERHGAFSINQIDPSEEYEVLVAELKQLKQSVSKVPENLSQYYEQRNVLSWQRSFNCRLAKAFLNCIQSPDTVTAVVSDCKGDGEQADQVAEMPNSFANNISTFVLPHSQSDEESDRVQLDFTAAIEASTSAPGSLLGKSSQDSYTRSLSPINGAEYAAINKRATFILPSSSSSESSDCDQSCRDKVDPTDSKGQFILPSSDDEESIHIKRASLFDDSSPLDAGVTASSKMDKLKISGLCSICSIKTDNESHLLNDELLRCKGPCNSTFHPSCYGIEDYDRSFICDSCAFMSNNPGTLLSCFLCNCRGGILRMSHDFSLWVHSICVLFTPELTVDSKTLRANNLKDLDPDRRGVMCCVCRRFGGSAVQCSYADCMTACHPYCALISGKQLVVSSLDSNSTNSADSESSGLNYEFLCPIHQDKLAYLSADILSCTIETSCKPSVTNQRVDRLKTNNSLSESSSPKLSGDFRSSRDKSAAIKDLPVNIESPFNAYPTPEIPRRRYFTLASSCGRRLLIYLGYARLSMYPCRRLTTNLGMLNRRKELRLSRQVLQRNERRSLQSVF
jgi:hypothetical protein